MDIKTWPDELKFSSIELAGRYPNGRSVSTQLCAVREGDLGRVAVTV